MNFQHSDYNNIYSNSYNRLNERIQKWIWKQNWNALNDIQELTIPIILDSSNDVIIASATASGKTEAAFFPILTACAIKKNEGLRAIYISPLKALINDQFNRLEELTENIKLSVTKWHGDVTKSKKKSFLENPTTILQITPESIESLLINNYHSLKNIFTYLEYIVIDEVHNFFGSERGMHLLSLINRIELIKGTKVRRIGLSATLGDFVEARKFIRKSNPESVLIVESSKLKQDIQLQIRGYQNQFINEDSIHKIIPSDKSITDDIFKLVRGSNNLIFANSRTNTERFALMLQNKCESNNVPNEFFPHYGNLSKEVREHLEYRLKSGVYPTSAVCTSTLELGIDIGKVKSINQIGVPPSVASLRQRLGRSGRRDEPARIRIYISEDEINKESKVQDLIRAELVQTVAMVELLIEKWYEPADNCNKHFSTIIHQILAIISQYGGCKANSLFKILVQGGDFSISMEEFIKLLRVMGKNNLIRQDSNELLLLAEEGEYITNHYSFYAVFNTPEEYILEGEGKILGTLPIIFPLVKKQLLIFNAKRWIIEDIEDKRKRIYLSPSEGGNPPKFFGDIYPVHYKVRQKMLEIYCSSSMPVYINDQALVLLQEAKTNFNRLKLFQTNFIEEDNGTLIFVWDGDKTINAIYLILIYLGFVVSRDGVTIFVNGSKPQLVKTKLKSAFDQNNINDICLAKLVVRKGSEKFDKYLDEDLMNIEYASKLIDLERAKSFISNIGEVKLQPEIIDKY